MLINPHIAPFAVVGSIPGIHNLPASLEINGTVENPSFRYVAIDSTATDWPTAGYGQALAIAGSGDAPTLTPGEPFHGPRGGQVGFAGAKYYASSNSSAVQLGTDDFVIEFIGQIENNAQNWRHVISQFNGANTPHWGLYWDGALTLLLQDADPDAAYVVSAAVGQNVRLHAMCFIDRSGSGQWYVNGKVHGNPVSVTAIGDLDSPNNFMLGASAAGAALWRGGIACVSLWQGSGWLAGHANEAVYLERWNLLTQGTDTIFSIL